MERPVARALQAKLQDGARVADVGCGLGSSTVLLAQAYPATTFAGSDYHAASIELARKQAADAGVTIRVSFEVASAQTFTGRDYDLIATLDCPTRHGPPRAADPGRAARGRHLAAGRAVRERRSPAT